MSDQLAPDRILQLGMGFWGSKALLSAVELGLFTALAQGPLEAEELRERLGLHSRGARDFFDALVALGMLERTDGRYANTPDTDLFLDRATRTYAAWAALTDGLRTGRPQSSDSGGGDFSVLYEDPARLRSFVKAMTPLATATGRVIAQKFPWGDYRSFVDVGTAEGAVPVRLALAHPHMSGLGFDLPPVGPLFDEFVAAHGLSDRLRFHPGDAFKDPIPAADVVVMGHLLHGCDLAGKRQLLDKGYAVLPEGGRLIVFDTLIDDERRRNVFGLLMSLNMLIETPGGSDYTGAECQGWMRDAGFRETYVQHLAGPDSMVVGVK
jgi:hypothetical protein